MQKKKKNAQRKKTKKQWKWKSEKPALLIVYILYHRQLADVSYKRQLIVAANI